MESQPPKSFADVLQRCTTFLSLSHQWAARKYTAEFLASLEYMREREIVIELTSMIEQCNCEEIAQLYEIALQFIRATVAIAADVVIQRGDAEEACMKPLMIVYKKIVDEFKAVSIDEVDWSDLDDAPQDKKVYMYDLLHLKQILMTSRANRDELAQFLQHCSIDKATAKLSSSSLGCPDAGRRGDRPIAPVNPRETGPTSVVEPVAVAGPSTSSAGQVSGPPAARKEEVPISPVKVEPGSCVKSASGASGGADTASATKSNIIIISDALMNFSSKLRITTRLIQLKFVSQVDNPNPIEWLLSGFQDIVNCIVRGRENTYVGVKIQCSGAKVLMGTVNLPFRPASKLTRENLWDLIVEASESIGEDIDIHRAMDITVQYVEVN